MAVKVAVVGSYNGGFTVKAPRLPVVGETLLGSGYVEGPGGKGSNQAVAAARLGAEVHLVSCIGADRTGDEALALWEREGVHVCVRRDDKAHTGMGMIFLLPEGENAILVAPGANAKLSTDDINLMEEAIIGCQVLLLQLEIPVETAVHAAKIAKDHDVKVVFNPAPVQALPAQAFRSLDVLTPNLTEARALTGERPDSNTDVEELAGKLMRLGTRSVVVTLGKEGAFVLNQQGGVLVSAPKVKTVDSTGAGDAFNGALAVALAQGRPLREAAQWACYAGAHCATKLEVIPGLAHKKELSAFVEEHRL